MKGSKYVHYINIASAILAILIIIVLFFGCNKKRENFENPTSLTDFQKQVIDDVKKGKIDNKTITGYIKDGKFTKDDLNDIIKHLAKESDKPAESKKSKKSKKKTK